MYQRKKHSLLAILLVMGLFCGLVSAFDPLADPDLIGWWTFDEGEGTVAADISPNGNDATVFGDPEWIAGVYKTGLNFDGADDYVSPEQPFLNNAADFTMAGWVLARNWNGGRVGLFGQNDLVEMGFNGNAASVWTSASGTTNAAWGFGDSSWHHIAVVDEGTEMKIYFDGEVAGTGSGGSHGSSGFNFNIGGGGVWDGTGNWFDGQMDDVVLFTRALTVEEILIVMEGAVAAELALNPDPSNEATDVPRDLLLGWQAGELAQTHNIYLGTSAEDVNAASLDNPLDVLQSEGQSETTFDPGRLELGQTYFWRVDEVNAPPDKTVFKGEIWSFTIEPVAYPIADVTATASSVHEPGMEADRTIDRSGLNANDEHSPDLAQMWLSNTSETEGVWIQYDLGKVYKLDRVHVWNHNSQTEAILGYGIKEALIETSTDGETWTELKTAEFAQATGSNDYTGAAMPLDGAMGQYVRITALSNHSILGLKQFGFSEVRFYYLPVQAREPMPADNGTSDGAEVLLGWRAGRDSGQHEVVFSDDMEAVADGSAVVGTVDDPSFDLGILDLGHTYYWKINEVNDLGTPPSYEGDLWTFQTPDHAMVDDMEMYAAEQGLFIWEHWIDGFQDPDNGSIVGNGDDAETSIVYEGRQSLPMAYDNSLSPASEATRFFDAPVDLTVGNPESLKLQVHGDAPGLVIDGDTITLGASGVDLWGTMDEGRFVYKTLSGDGSITAKVESLTNVNDWAKTGVMIRESDGADSVDAYMVTSAASGLSFQYRLETFVNATSDTGTRSDVWINHNERPVWVRVERIGDLLNGYISVDGTTWEPSTSNPQTIVMIPDVKIGLCATSHDNAFSTVAVLSNITTTGNVTGDWQMVEWGEGHPSNDAAPLYVRLADTAGNEKVFDHPDPAATNLQAWDEWTIPLTELGTVNPTKIDSITVGVGGSGSTGIIYVDAIRTAKPYPEPAPTE